MFTKDSNLRGGDIRLAQVSVVSIGFALVIIGFMLAFLAVILLVFKARGTGKTRGGGILLIGPIPIIFGSDRESAKILMILAIILIAIVLVFMILPSLLLSR